MQQVIHKRADRIKPGMVVINRADSRYLRVHKVTPIGDRVQLHLYDTDYERSWMPPIPDERNMEIHIYVGTTRLVIGSYG